MPWTSPPHRTWIEPLEPRRLAYAPLDLPELTADIDYEGPITITSGGSYSGNWQSFDPDVPAVTIVTDEPVTIENSNIRSRNACIDVLGGGDITVRNTTGFGLNPEWETANTSPYGPDTIITNTAHAAQWDVWQLKLEDSGILIGPLA